MARQRPAPRSGRTLPALRAAVLGLLLAAAPAGAADRLDIAIGRALFKRPWVPAPSSTRADDGLGPLFDARSCAACHPGDARARAAFDAAGHLDGRGVVLMIARPDGTGDPVYGRRLQIDAVPGLQPEGIIGATDTALADGRRRRRPAVSALAYGPLAPDSGISLRVAPDLRGRGAMAAVTDATLLALEAEQAGGTDGVTGRARRITLPDGRRVLGRFGWKAAHPDLRSQSAEAFFLDLGLSTALHPEPWGDCTPAQAACRNAPHGTTSYDRQEREGALEIPDAVLDRVVAYVAALAVPRPNPGDGAGAATARGAHLFASAGCARCHRPELPTASGGARLYSDLLLHDMGPELADTMPEPGAGAAEWRTAPLAGISDALARDTGLLHDGRARTVAEAVAWHGGEAGASVRRFNALPDADRAALIRYVSSL